MAKRTPKKAVKPPVKPAAKRRSPRAVSPRGRKKGPGKFAALFLPMVLSVLILGCLAFLGLMGYRTVTASDFFDVKQVEISGVGRSSKEDIQRIVNIQTEKSGSWNADLPEIKQKIERLSFIKAAAVSRVLPNGIRVNVVERVPQAVVRLNSGDFLVDGEGVVLAPSLKPEEQFPVVLKGWDEEKSEKADKSNKERIALYNKMLEEWRQYEIVRRVKEINLADLRDPRAMVEESGSPVMVSLSKEELGKSLKTALEAIVGKGNKVKSVNAGGAYPVLEYIGN